MRMSGRAMMREFAYWDELYRAVKQTRGKDISFAHHHYQLGTPSTSPSFPHPSKLQLEFGWPL